MTRKNTGTETVKAKVNEIEEKLGRGEITVAEALDLINKLKDEYVQNIRKERPKVKDPEQSWHAFIGREFQKLVFNAFKGYVKQLQEKHPELRNVRVLSESEVKRKARVRRKLAVKYGNRLLLPDADIVIVTCNHNREPEKVLAIISCKTSLRERIAQACYWKLKLSQSESTKHIKVYLATRDNDGDFNIRKNGKSSRNRIIAEHELDGIYIIKDDFKDEWESNKVKKYGKIPEDLIKLVREVNAE